MRVLALAVLLLGLFPSRVEASGPDLSLIRPPGEALAFGEVGWREVVVPIGRRGAEAAWATVIGAAPVGLRVLPFAEVVSSGRRSVRVRVAVAAEPGAESGIARASLVVSKAARGPTLGRAEVRVRVRLLPSDPLAVETVPLLAEAHSAWLKRAEALRPPARRSSRLTAIRREAPPPTEQRRAALAFERARLEAWALRLRLRAAVLSKDRALQTAAFRTLSRIEVEPGPLPEGTVADTLRDIRNKLQRGEVIEARRNLASLRRAGTASRRELAPLLVLEGLIATAAGRRAAADVAFGQALCLEPRVDVSIRVEMLAEAWRAARLSRPCGSQGLAVGSLKAERRMIDGRPALVVEGEVQNDPYRLATEVLVERFGPGGGFAQEARIEITAERRFVATLTGTREALHAPDAASVRVTLYEGTGVPIAELGRPNPVRVDLEDGEGVGGFSVPGWLWITLGGVALAGAATWGILELSESSDVERGLGPFTVDF